MINNNLNSFDALIETLEKLPSIGKKSAQKMAYSLCVENKFLALKIAHCIEEAVLNVKKCNQCGGLSEGEICNICTQEDRDNSQLCIVSHPKDIFTIEDTRGFNGKYLVIDSLENVDFGALKQRIKKYNITEVIFGFSPSLANDAIILYIEDKLNDLGICFSKIAQGVPTGIGLDNIDQLSLYRALQGRIKI